MSNTALFSFSNAEDRNLFLRVISNQCDGIQDPGLRQFMRVVIDSVVLDAHIKTESDRHGALFVAGVKMKEGLIQSLNKDFALECDSTKSTVELKELINNKFVTIRHRKQSQNSR